jgi:hypothetical protein
VVGWGRQWAVVCDVNRCCLAPIWDGSLPTYDVSAGRLAGVSSSLPTLYKARGLSTKQPVCAVCVERTRGRTQKVTLGYGVVVWLCGGHAGRDFQTRRSGRDFARTLSGVWQANGCLTQARSRALHGHLASLKAQPRRRRPGSYAWPELRRQVEAAYRDGLRPVDLADSIHTTYATCPAHPPSRRTLERWAAQRRWLTARPPP